MIKNFLEVKNVDFSIGGNIKVKNVSFSIENEGDIVCLLGPSGIGKTTILRTIAGLEKIYTGFIKLNNRILSSNETHIEPEHRNISLAFQENSLFPHYTVEKNILLGAERNKQKKDKKISLKEIVKILGITHILDKYPHQISAGEAQRASLARSLITKPDLLLLDEPLSNVDQSFKEEIQVKLKKILSKLKISTIIVEIFNLFNIFFNLTCISSLKLWSTLDKGSSNNNRSGFVISDLASEALCASPALIS